MCIFEIERMTLRSDNACAPYDGYMDNVRIWNAALTGSALNANKNRHLHAENVYLPYLLANYSFYNFFNDEHTGAHNSFGIPEESVAAFFSGPEDKPLEPPMAPSAADHAPAAAYFNGLYGFTTPYDPALAPSDALTFEAWIKPGSGVKGETLAAMGLPPSGWGVMLMCNGAVPETYCCSGASHTENTVGLFAGTSACQDIPSSDVAVTRDVWSHVAVTVKPLEGVGKTISFFINGQPAGIRQGAAYAIGDGGGVNPFMLGGMRCSAGTRICASYTGRILFTILTQCTGTQIQISQSLLYHSTLQHSK